MRKGGEEEYKIKIEKRVGTEAGQHFDQREREKETEMIRRMKHKGKERRNNGCGQGIKNIKGEGVMRHVEWKKHEH